MTLDFLLGKHSFETKKFDFEWLFCNSVLGM